MLQIKSYPNSSTFKMREQTEPSWITSCRRSHRSIQLETAIARARRQIELVQEYGTRLIADVVTGKLDVREAAAQLVEEDDEVDPIDEGGIMLDNMDGGSFDESQPTEEELAIESEVGA